MVQIIASDCISSRVSGAGCVRTSLACPSAKGKAGAKRANDSESPSRLAGVIAMERPDALIGSGRERFTLRAAESRTQRRRTPQHGGQPISTRLLVSELYDVKPFRRKFRPTSDQVDLLVVQASCLRTAAPGAARQSRTRHKNERSRRRQARDTGCSGDQGSADRGTMPCFSSSRRVQAELTCWFSANTRCG